MRLIDVNDAIERLRKAEAKMHTINGVKAVDIGAVISFMQNQLVVDAVPVVYGRWRYYSTTMQECSECQRHTARHKFKYCPHCGAFMEDKNNDG